jgi:hypothetical protein
LSKIVNTTNLTIEQYVTVEKALQNIKIKSIIGKRMIDFLIKNDIKIDFKYDPTINVGGYYFKDKSNNNQPTIKIKDIDNLAERFQPLEEELFHCSQNAFYGDEEFSTVSKRGANIEMEAKLAHDMGDIVAFADPNNLAEPAFDGQRAFPLPATEDIPATANYDGYETFLKEITNFGTYFSTSFDDIQKQTYINFVKNLPLYSGGYESFGVDINFQPAFLFYLLNRP